MTDGTRIDFAPSGRQPDPCIEVLDKKGLALRLLSSTVQQLATGFTWAEGPVWFGDGRFLLFSDIPHDRIVRWDECSGTTATFRQPSHFANGLARDRAGRLVACEHGSRRVTRTEYDGRITVLAERYQGKRLNSPNDVVCARDGALWFTDPPFGLFGWWEGEPTEPELPHGVYRLDPSSGALQCVADDLQGPNGLAFSPDESVLYVVESLARPHRAIWAYDVRDGTLHGKRRFVDAGGPGLFDGIAVDTQGNVWCGFGSDGSHAAQPDALDGVRVYDAHGLPLLRIRLPERCANLCFGGARRNRLFMACGHSLYAVDVNARGAA